MSYENWVDSLIQTHKQRLDNLRIINRDRECDYSYSGRMKRYSYNQDTSSDFYQDEFKLIKQKKVEKMFDSLVEENAQLRFCLSEKEKLVKEISDSSRLTERDNKGNSNLSLEREKDLLETLKIVNFENKRLEETVTELKLELSKKNRDLEIALTERNGKSSFVSSGSPFFNDADSPTHRKLRKLNVDEDTTLLCLKFDKLIEIFLSFFSKFEITLDLNPMVKSFDYENLKIKLKEFESFIKGGITNGEYKMENNNSFTNFKQNSPALDQTANAKSRNLTSTQNQIRTGNTSIGDSELITKLDQRLKDLESNFNSLIKQRSVSGGKKIVNENKPSDKRTTSGLNQASNTAKSKNLINQIKNTKINTSKLGNSFANNMTNTTSGFHSSRVHGTNSKAMKK